MTTRTNPHDLALATPGVALAATMAFAAVLALAAPVRAAVIQVSSNAERSPRYSIPEGDGGAVRIVGTIQGSIQGQRLVTEATTATLLPRMVFDGLPIVSAMGNFRDLDPVTVAVPAVGAGVTLVLSIAVDLSLDIGTAAEFGMRPDLFIARENNPYENPYSFLTFAGTLSTGADALGTVPGEGEAPPSQGGGATNVPEPAAFAVLGVGLLGLAVARRRAA